MDSEILVTSTLAVEKDAERFLVNMFLKMTYYPGLGKFFFAGDFVFHGTYLIVILLQELFS